MPIFNVDGGICAFDQELSVTHQSQIVFFSGINVQIAYNMGMTMIRITLILMATFSWQWSAMPMSKSCMMKSAPKTKCCCGDSSDCKCCCKKNNKPKPTNTNEKYNSCQCSNNELPVVVPDQIKEHRPRENNSTIFTVVEIACVNTDVSDSVRANAHSPPDRLYDLHTIIIIV